MFQQITDHKALTPFYAKNGLEVSPDPTTDGAFYSIAKEADCKIVAAATLSRRNGVFVLDYIAVDPAFRGFGLGKTAFELIKQKAILSGAECIYITTKVPSFFEKLGFKYGEPKEIDLNAECHGCPQLKVTCHPKNMKLTLTKETHMTREKFIKLKAGLLCKGAALSESARAFLLKNHPDYFEKGFIDAVNMNVGGSNICVSIAEDFSKESDFLLDFYGSCFINFEGERADVRFFHDLVKTGTIIDGMARLHADGCINIWPSTNCCYDTPELKCKFCSLGAKTLKPIDPDELCKGLKIYAEHYPDYTFNFSGGTYKNPDTMVKYWISLAEKIREFCQNPIAVEFAPPSDLSLLEKMKQSGINVCIMNIEIVDSALRKEICPGKSGITLEHYHKALEKAVKVFGRGQVSSVMIGGLQEWDDILAECELLTDLGVFPTIMPFRPLDDCPLSNVEPCDPDELIAATEKLGELLRKHDLAPHRQPGCTKCGGCSIENDCYKKA